jgi:Protein of unknown function (DUF3551)
MWKSSAATGPVLLYNASRLGLLRWPEEAIMRAIGLGSITLATLALTATDVRGANNNWCATYTKPENENCTFATFEQCQATVRGVGGWCRANPFPNTAFGTGWSWSKPPRQSRSAR